MKIFVCEYTCVTAPGACPISDALSAEGAAMLAAVLEDFTRLPAVDVACLLPQNHALAIPISVHQRLHIGDEEKHFRALAHESDYSLIIAPESDNILLERRRWVDESGGRWLGCSLAAIDLTGDKFQLAKHLLQAKVPTPQTSPLSQDETPSQGEFPVILKPRHGAGSHHTCLVNDSRQLREYWTRLQASECRDEIICQPYVPGLPASMAFIVGANSCMPLMPAIQHLSDDGRFRYLGGMILLAGDLGERALRLATRTVQAIPGLLGYVGVDLVLGNTSAEDYVIEVNPRLTTSYVGLRRLAQTNLAEAMLRAVGGDWIPEVAWGKGSVRFWANGRVEFV